VSRTAAEAAPACGERMIEVEPQKGTFVAKIRWPPLPKRHSSPRPRNRRPSRQCPNRRRTLQRSTGRHLPDDRGEGEGRRGVLRPRRAFPHPMRSIVSPCAASPKWSKPRAPSRAHSPRPAPTPGRNQATLREHRVILSALEEHGPAAAAAAMGAHLDQGIANSGNSRPAAGAVRAVRETSFRGNSEPKGAAKLGGRK